MVTNSFLIVPLKLKTFHHKNKHHALCLSKSLQSVSYYFLLWTQQTYANTMLLGITKTPSSPFLLPLFQCSLLIKPHLQALHPPLTAVVDEATVLVSLATTRVMTIFLSTSSRPLETNLHFVCTIHFISSWVSILPQHTRIIIIFKLLWNDVGDVDYTPTSLVIILYATGFIGTIKVCL